MSYTLSSELNSQTVSPGCSYSTLAKYNASAARSVQPTHATTQYLLVPTYGGAAYNTLQHGLPSPGNSCGEYFNINTAYGACPGSLTSLAGRNCK